MSMSDIRIRRFENHPHAWQGCIEPTAQVGGCPAWQLCVDENGAPHLYLRVFAEVEVEVDGKVERRRVAGLMDYELGNEFKIADLLDSEADGEVSDEEAAATWAELQADGYRCPVMGPR